MSEMSPQQLVHRTHMERLMDRLYDAYNTHGESSIQLEQARAEYNAHVGKGIAAYPEWDCSIVDPIAHSTHSDVYKDHNGIRPRWHMTHAEVVKSLAYLDSQPFDDE